MAKIDYHLEINGLSQNEVDNKQKSNGYNEIPSQKKKSIITLITNLFQEPMLFILFASIIIYFLLGEKTDAIMLSSFVAVVLGMTFYEERKTERALEALRDLSSPRALVIRDGKHKRIAGREVVQGDIILLKEGDRVPADGKIISCTNFTIDESLLTGESIPVTKSEEEKGMSPNHSGGNSSPFIYSGTLVVQGTAIAEVTEIGKGTQMGKIGKVLSSIKNEETRIQKETRSLVNKLFGAGIVLCIIVAVLYGMTRGNWLQGMMMGLTLGMSILPQEFSVVLIIFLTLGAWRISKRHVLTRNMPVVETLGAATVLCVDKTGTLTQNRMTLHSMISADMTKSIELGNGFIPSGFDELLKFSYLSCQKETFDPMEKAIKENIGKNILELSRNIHEWKVIKVYPLDKNILTVTQIWELPQQNNYLIAAKGAPESVLKLCHFSNEQAKMLMSQVQKLANTGQRVLAVAKSSYNGKTLPGKKTDFQYEFLGLIGFIDPVRSSVKKAIAECYTAGVRVVMITGDYEGTAQHVAIEIGLKSPEKFLTGEQIEKMSHDELVKSVKEINIFARIAPEQKLLIVNAFKANHEVVTMTGDGVNDAPALKAAHIGIAMGERGTDVAREAADLVLLKDDFSSIVQAMKTGRKIFDNLKKAMSYIVAAHLPIAGLSLFPVLFKLPIILMPAHIAFLELVINPACSAVFEGEKSESNIMTKPPRKLSEPLFTKRRLIVSSLQGISVLTIVLLVYMYDLLFIKDDMDARALAFTALILSNLALIITNRSWDKSIFGILKTPNKAMTYVISGTVICLALIFLIPGLRTVFHFKPLHMDDIVLTLVAGGMSIMWFELLKIYRTRNIS